MTALIAVESPEGQVTGSCDAKCYNAMGPECDCSCQGAHHGMGRELAIQHTRELAGRQAAADAAGAPDPALDRLVFLLPEAEADAEAEAEAG